VAEKDLVQVNARVPRDTVEILDAAVYLRRLKSRQVLLRSLIDEYVERVLHEEPEIQTTLRARQEHDARHAGKLSPIARKKQVDGKT
jgi:hypothetical protein